MTVLEQRLDAFAGSTLITPVRLPDGPTLTFAPLVTTSDGRPVTAFLARFEATLGSLDDWLGPCLRWSTRVLTPSNLERAGSDPDGAGFWALVIETPPDARAGPLRVDGRIVPTQWLPDPDRSPYLTVEPSPLPALDTDPGALRDRFAASATDPAMRWRVVLLGARPGEVGELALAALAASPIADPLVAALAEQTSRRWRAALARLAKIDPEEAALVNDRLASVARVAEAPVPVWASGAPSLDDLLGALLAPDAGADSLRSTAREWRRREPSRTIRVTDDARELTREGIALTVEMTDRVGRADPAQLVVPPPVESLQRWDLPGATRTLPAAGARVELPAHGTVVATAVAPFAASFAFDGPVRPRSVGVRAGETLEQRPVRCDPIPVRPPGGLLGPLMSALELTDWDRETARPAPPEWNGAALLQRSMTGDSWELHVECRTPMASTADAPDRVSVFFGPRGRPTCVLTVDSAGSLVVAIGSERRRNEVRVVREADRWTAALPIPPEALVDPQAAPGRRLVLAGMERRCSAGRFTWPRAVAAWETEPGRLCFDLGAWSDAPTQGGQQTRP